MNQINLRALLLATLVIIMFIGVGISLSYRNVMLVLLFFIFGCLVMGYGIYRKTKSDS